MVVVAILGNTWISRMDNMEITSSKPKYYLVRSGKGLIDSLGNNNIIRSKKERQGIPLLISV